jgi:hypothetical protein
MRPLSIGDWGHYRRNQKRASQALSQFNSAPISNLPVPTDGCAVVTEEASLWQNHGFDELPRLLSRTVRGNSNRSAERIELFDDTRLATCLDS